MDSCYVISLLSRCWHWLQGLRVAVLSECFFDKISLNGIAITAKAFNRGEYEYGKVPFFI